MRIDRHVIDDSYSKDMRKRFERTFEDLRSYVDGAKQNPKNLSLLIGRSHASVAFGCIVDPQSPKIRDALLLAADAYTAMFAAAVNPSGVAVKLAGESVMYTSPPDESTVDADEWTRGFYFNVLVDAEGSLDSLCRVPNEVVRRSSTKVPGYKFLYMESLRAFEIGQSNTIVDTLLAAIHATDPKRPDVFDPDWTLYLDVPQLEVLIYLVTEDAKFGGALVRAVERHKKYWSKTKDSCRDYKGYISVELTALAALGKRRGLQFDVESDYLPMHLVRH